MTEWPLEVADQDLATGASAQDSARETLPHGHEADVHAHDDRVIAIVVGMFQHMRRLAKGHKTRVALDIENEGIQLLPRVAHVAREACAGHRLIPRGRPVWMSQDSSSKRPDDGCGLYNPASS